MTIFAQDVQRRPKDFEGLDRNIHSLFYTNDEEKAKRILDILKS